MRFVTRVNIHIDRISTAWAIRRFIDAEATFLFVDRTADVSTLNAIPFDMRGAELGHHRGLCTFETLLDKYELRDPALRRMGEIIRAVDVPADGDPPATFDWVAPAFDDLRGRGLSDDRRLAQGSSICERLYRACGGATQLRRGR